MQDFCRKAASQGIATMASGGRAPLFRFYFYAKPVSSDAVLLVEVLVDKSAGSASVTVKSRDAANVQAFVELVRSCLESMAR
jgi:hypothetical protein